jgi:RNA polymerase sigma factor (sigma-70 family)
MEHAPKVEAMAEQDVRISEAFERERTRLRNFIRSRVPNDADVEDLLQDVFSELVEAERLMKPLQQVGAWLFRVARNRIIDRFRRKASEGVQIGNPAIAPEKAREGEGLFLEELLPGRDAGPEEVYAREVLLDELNVAIDELPEEQRDVFVAHELEGRSFQELAAETGIPLNTLLSRKHSAVLHLRQRLRDIYREFVEP